MHTYMHTYMFAYIYICIYRASTHAHAHFWAPAVHMTESTRALVFRSMSCVKKQKRPCDVHGLEVAST